MIGAHPIKVHGKTQRVIALGNAESKFYFVVKAAAMCLGIVSLIKDLGLDKKLRTKVDAPAVLSISQRKKGRTYPTPSHGSYLDLGQLFATQ